MNPSSGAQQITGVVERIIFRALDTGFAVLVVREKGSAETVKVVGYTEAKEGDELTSTGAWEAGKHGPQFKAASIVATTPATREGMIKFLSSGMIQGVGPKSATRIVDHFGADTIEVLDTQPERLTEVPGIGKTKAHTIKTSWNEHQAVRQIMLFLQSNGVSPAQSFRIYKTYGSEAVDVIRRDPYRLATDVRGIGFKSADQIAMNLGIPRDSAQRIRAGLDYTLGEAMTRGQCGLIKHQLLVDSAEILGLSYARIAGILDAELVEKRPSVVEHDGEIYSRWIAHCEEQIAAGLIELSRGKPPMGQIVHANDLQSALQIAERKLGFPLARQQQEAVMQALGSKVAVITGGPGVGKTTILNALIGILLEHGVNVALAAPTGKAAKRMAETTGLEAKTIHRLIGLQSEEDEHEGALKFDYLIVDEFSMVDVPLFFKLLQRFPLHAGLLMVGDVDQLPSVGPGQLLSDVINSGKIQVSRLTKIFRQAEGSQIIQNAHRVNRGEMPQNAVDAALVDFYFIERDKPELIAQTISEIVIEIASMGYDPMRDVQVLAPMKRTITGTIELNRLIQQTLNPRPAAAIQRFDTIFCVGDRVIQLENNYAKSVFNGDTGQIVEIDEEDRSVFVEFDGQTLEYDFNELDSLNLAYAISIHKSQGSQFPVVIIPVTTQHFMMLQRNLLYTGITRAANLCILVGQAEAVKIAVGNERSARRVSRIQRLLRGGVSGQAHLGPLFAG